MRRLFSGDELEYATASLYALTCFRQLDAVAKFRLQLRAEFQQAGEWWPNIFPRYFLDIIVCLLIIKDYGRLVLDVLVRISL